MLILESERPPQDDLTPTASFKSQQAVFFSTFFLSTRHPFLRQPSPSLASDLLNSERIGICH